MITHSCTDMETSQVGIGTRFVAVLFNPVAMVHCRESIVVEVRQNVT